MSVVVATRNRKDILARVLDALARQDYPDYQLIVADDASTDGTADLVRQRFPSIRLLAAPGRGPAAARNAGTTLATGEIVAFIDDDCLPPLDWLSRLADGYRRHPAAAGVGGYQEAPEDLLATRALARYERYVNRRVYGELEEEVLGGASTPVGATNNMSYRRGILEALGGFDEGFPFPAGEDTDLKLRVCTTGRPVLYLPLKVTHLRDYDWSGFRRQQLVRGRGTVHFARKHGPSMDRKAVAWGFLATSVRLLGRMVRGPERDMVAIHLYASWCNAWGRWLELRELAGRERKDASTRRDAHGDA